MTAEQTVIFVNHKIRPFNSDSRNVTRLNYAVLGTQLTMNKLFVTRVCTTVYIVVVCCPSVLWPKMAPIDNRLLSTGWWLRKATHGGVVMATKACQTDCVEIGQVWTYNQYPPPSITIWHFRHIFAVKTYAHGVQVFVQRWAASAPSHRSTNQYQDNLIPLS